MNHGPCVSPEVRFFSGLTDSSREVVLVRAEQKSVESRIGLVSKVCNMERAGARDLC